MKWPATHRMYASYSTSENVPMLIRAMAVRLRKIAPAIMVATRKSCPFNKTVKTIAVLPTSIITIITTPVCAAPPTPG